MGSDEMVARAARVSTGKDQLDQGKIEGLIRYLVAEQHTSPLESCVATFRISAPLFVVNQIVRHRAFSYSALSHRYTEATPEFYVPELTRPLVNEGTSARPHLVAGSDLLPFATQWAHHEAFTAAWDAYRTMIDAGVANEVARNVLPQATYTSLYMTGNLNNWMKFLHLRTGLTGHPQYEIAEVANEIQYQLECVYPITMGAWASAR